MSDISNGKWKLLSFVLIGALVSGIGTMAALGHVPLFTQQEQVNSPQLLPSAYGAGALTNVFALPSNNLYSAKTYYVLAFTTATTGTIKNITMTFPAGFNVASAKLVEVQNIGAGSLSISGQTLTYMISSPISVTAPRAIKIMIADITNAAVTSNQVAVTTKDTGGLILDGPTNSATFTLIQIQNWMIGSGSVSLSKLSANAIDSTKIQDGKVTGADIQSGVALNGGVSIDSPTFKVDSVNNRVGIGTTTPANTLHVLSTDDEVARFESTGLKAISVLNTQSAGFGCKALQSYEIVGTPKWSAGVGCYPSSFSYELVNWQTGTLPLFIDGNTNKLSADLAPRTVQLEDMSFMKHVTLADDTSGNTAGWNPNGSDTAFTILDEVVDSTSSIVVTIDNADADAIVCMVFDIDEIEFDTDNFRIKCVDGSPPNGSVLNYTIINIG